MILYLGISNLKALVNGLLYGDVFTFYKHYENPIYRFFKMSILLAVIIYGYVILKYKN